MGMYTGLRGTVVLRQEFTPKMADMLEVHYLSDEDPWPTVLPEGHPWLSVGRQRFIPWGSQEVWHDGLDPAVTVDRETNEFTFGCSLKNYENEIETFLTLVLPLIAVSWDLEMQYEEHDKPTRIYQENTQGQIGHE